MRIANRSAQATLIHVKFIQLAKLHCRRSAPVDECICLAKASLRPSRLSVLEPFFHVQCRSMARCVQGVLTSSLGSESLGLNSDPKLLWGSRSAFWVIVYSGTFFSFTHQNDSHPTGLEKHATNKKFRPSGSEIGLIPTWVTHRVCAH